MAKRSDILSEFTMEETINPSLLNTYLTRHPKYVNDLLDLYHELMMLEIDWQPPKHQL